MHKTSERFWKCFDKLPKNIQESARENFERLKTEPNYPSLQFKRIGKRDEKIKMMHFCFSLAED